MRVRGLISSGFIRDAKIESAPRSPHFVQPGPFQARANWRLASAGVCLKSALGFSCLVHRLCLAPLVGLLTSGLVVSRREVDSRALIMYLFCLFEARVR